MFRRGQPKLAGRKKGTQNKSTQSVGQFCRDVLETTEFQEKWRDYFKTTPLRVIEPKLLTMAFAYAYGKPRERFESTGMEGGKPLEVEHKLDLTKISDEDLKTLEEITLRAEGRTVKVIESVSLN